MEIRKSDFFSPKSPEELNCTVEYIVNEIYGDTEIRKNARLRYEPFKTFLEEYLPFNDFCQYKYKNRKDVNCFLFKGKEYDAVVEKESYKHIIEITWPIDGQYIRNMSLQLNERGYTNNEIYAFDDTTKHENEIKRVIKIAKKKSIKDYEWSGDSTLLIVFSRNDFRDENPKHKKILLTLVTQLKSIEYKVKNVLLLLKYDNSNEFIRIK